MEQLRTPEVLKLREIQRLGQLALLAGHRCDRPLPLREVAIAYHHWLSSQTGFDADEIPFDVECHDLTELLNRGYLRLTTERETTRGGKRINVEPSLYLTAKGLRTILWWNGPQTYPIDSFLKVLRRTITWLRANTEGGMMRMQRPFREWHRGQQADPNGLTSHGRKGGVPTA